MIIRLFMSITNRHNLTAILLLVIFTSISVSLDTVCQCERFPIDGKPFVAVWNSPTGGCYKNFTVKIDLDDYQIRANPDQTWNGKYVVVFYNAQLGYYPYFTNPAGTRSYNGGMPQLIDINAHLEKSTRDIIGRIPDPHFDGLAVIDWEGWRPTWKRNWDSKKIYQTRSIDLLRNQHPEWPMEQLVDWARKRFEDSARIMMQETLKLGKHLRPRAKWGFYGFPDCYGNKDTDYQCSTEVKDQNDALSWMFSTSSALYPSIYLPERTSTNRHFVNGRLTEAFRLAAKYKKPDSPLPVFPYFRMIYEKKPLDYEFLTDVDLQNTIGQAADFGAAGIVMWGNRRDENTSPFLCKEINNYVHNKLGPFFMSTQLATEKCSNKQCNGNGRCIKKEHSDALDYAYNNTCPGQELQTTENLEKMLKHEKQVIGVSSTGETKVININKFADKLQGLKHSLAQMETSKPVKPVNKTNEKPNIKAANKSIIKTLNDTKPTKKHFVTIVKTDKIPFLDVDLSENETANFNNSRTASQRSETPEDPDHEEIPSETIFCNKTESGTTKCMLVRRHDSMKLSKHNGFQIPQIYAILISISLGGALVLSTVYIGTYYYFNVYKKKY